MDRLSALPKCFPVASFGKPTGPDQKKILHKYLCNYQCEKRLSMLLTLTSIMEYQLQI